MHINVRDILAEEIGYNRTYKLSGEMPLLENVRLLEPIEGEITIGRLDDGVMLQGAITTSIELECHRCLRSYARPTRVSLAQLYTERPDEDELPIEANEIDLAPLVEQEILVNLPIKLLDRPDCPGVEGYVADETGPSLQNKARITKGSTRGRT